METLVLRLRFQLSFLLETTCFAETPSRYLLEVAPEKVDELFKMLGEAKTTVVGTFTDDATVTVNDCSWNIDELRNAWLGGLQI